MDDRTVLPMRYGTLLRDVDELLAVMTSRQNSFRRALDRVRGCVEMGVRAKLDASDGIGDRTARSGTDYLRVRAAEQSDEQAIVGTVHGRLASISSAADKRIRRGAVAPVFVGAYLVPERQLECFRDAVHELIDDHPHVSIACTGPWPPHSFAATGELES
jgi:hypothetical protein